MCCTPCHEDWEIKNAVGECSNCGAAIDEDGDSLDPSDCQYSPVDCDECGSCPCDGSC